MHRKKTPKTVVLTQTTEEYASRSSIHGIGYAFDRELSTFDRVLWLLVVLVFLAVAAALTLNLWTQWRNEQVRIFPFFTIFIANQTQYQVNHFKVVTILKNTTKLVAEVPFPALTICGSGVHMGNVEKKLVQDFKDCYYNKET